MNSEYKETYSYFLRLKTSVEEDAIRLQPRSSEAYVFFPNSLGDDLLVEVQDSKGKQFGRILVQVAAIADDPADKLCGWPIYHEPDHELVGKIQLYIIYSTSADDNSHLKVFDVLLGSFQRTVLNTYKSKFTQFVMFYACALDPEECGVKFAMVLLEMFVCDVNPPITTCVCLL